MQYYTATFHMTTIIFLLGSLVRAHSSYRGVASPKCPRGVLRSPGGLLSPEEGVLLAPVPGVLPPPPPGVRPPADLLSSY